MANERIDTASTITSSSGTVSMSSSGVRTYLMRGQSADEGGNPLMRGAIL